MVITQEMQVTRTPSNLNSWHRTQRSIEKLRVEMGNRKGALERGVDTAEKPVLDFYSRLDEDLRRYELEAEQMMSAELPNYAVYDYWLRHVKGIGEGLSAQMLSMLLPPIPEKAVSSWYKAGGLAPEVLENGETHLPRARAVQEGLSYYPWLRRCLYNVATSFVRNGGYYRQVYEREKERFQLQHGGDWQPIRIDHVARWRTVKLFLSHLWDAWCECENIPARRKPWIIEYGGHSTVIERPLWDGKGKI